MKQQKKREYNGWWFDLKTTVKEMWYIIVIVGMMLGWLWWLSGLE